MFTFISSFKKDCTTMQIPFEWRFLPLFACLQGKQSGMARHSSYWRVILSLHFPAIWCQAAMNWYSLHITFCHIFNIYAYRWTKWVCNADKLTWKTSAAVKVKPFNYTSRFLSNFVVYFLRCSNRNSLFDKLSKLWDIKFGREVLYRYIIRKNDSCIWRFYGCHAC